jgi:hypothetical protein
MALSGRKRVVLAETAEAYDDACDDEHEFLRKVRTLAGNYQLIAKMPRLLLPGLNPMWFQLTSHKVLRLLCPWALIALFYPSEVLAFHSDVTVAGVTSWRALFFLQAALYVLAALGSRAGRLGVLARTFVILNAAAVVGLWRFVRGTQPVAW